MMIHTMAVVATPVRMADSIATVATEPASASHDEPGIHLQPTGEQSAAGNRWGGCRFHASS